MAEKQRKREDKPPLPLDLDHPLGTREGFLAPVARADMTRVGVLVPYSMQIEKKITCMISDLKAGPRRFVSDAYESLSDQLQTVDAEKRFELLNAFMGVVKKISSFDEGLQYVKNSFSPTKNPQYFASIALFNLTRDLPNLTRGEITAQDFMDFDKAVSLVEKAGDDLMGTFKLSFSDLSGARSAMRTINQAGDIRKEVREVAIAVLLNFPSADLSFLKSREFALLAGRFLDWGDSRGSGRESSAFKSFLEFLGRQIDFEAVKKAVRLAGAFKDSELGGFFAIYDCKMNASGNGAGDFSEDGQIRKMLDVFDKLGIEYYHRYSHSLLENVYLTATDANFSKNKRIACLLMNKSDPKGAFEFDNSYLEGLVNRGYAIVLAEDD